MCGTLLNERPEIVADRATLIQWISNVFKLRGIARGFRAQGAKNWIEGHQLALQVSDRLRCLLDAVHEGVDFFTYLKCKCCDA
jgi:hypothetical protein